MNEIKARAAKTPLRTPRFNDIAPSLVLMLASRAAAIGMLPFGVALFAAVFDKSAAYIGIAAVCIGVMSAAGAAAVPKYLIAMILFWLFSRMYRKRDERIRSAVCGGSVLIGGCVMLLVSFNGAYDLFMLVTESIIASLMYIVFRKARIISDDFSKSGGMSAEEYVSAAVAIGVIIAGTGGIAFGPVRVSNILAVYTILITALYSTVAISGCTGLCIGFMCAMSSSECIVMMGIYGMSAVFSSFMNNYRKIGCAIGYVCGASVTFIYAKNMYNIPMNLLDVLLGVVLFIVTPGIMLEYFRAFFNRSMHIESVSPELRMREYLTMRLRRTGEAFRSLYEAFMAVSEGRLKKYSGDIGTILDETTERVCSGCKMCGKCWQTDFRRTYKNVLELIGIIETDGLLSKDNIPPRFCERCVRTDMFIQEINHVYELYKRDVLRRSDAVTTRNLISTQYNELNRLLAAMADDITDGFLFLEKEEERLVAELDKIDIAPYEVSVVESTSGNCEVYLRLPPVIKQTAVEGVISEVLGRAVSYERSEKGLCKYISRPGFDFDVSVLQLPEDGSEVNGDCVTVFTDGASRFYAIVADGMGSGSEARYESAAALRLLTGFLKAGFSVRTALGMLNSSMCLNMDNEIYSTVDILSVNLYTGEAELYKIGSAETIINCGDEVRSVTSRSAPVGIVSEIHPDCRKLKLREGDTILMLTDGITEAGYSISHTEWLKKIIIKPFENMDELSREVMDAALKKSRGRAKDDMSIIALRLQSV